MKTVLQVTIIFIAITSLSYGQANTTLSNLVSPTAVNQSLIPNNNNGRDLGSAGKSWRSLYIDSNVYLRDVRFIHNTGKQNAFAGEGAGNVITKGKNNAAFGYHALYATKTQSFNAAFGSFALAKNTGADNSAFGYNALLSNTTGVHNTATGSLALQHNTTGNNNTANGFQALNSNNGGNENTALGVSSLYSNISGNDNTATGFAALNSNTGSLNTAHGAYALYLNSSGANNTATGYEALYQNTTGSYNTANGLGALTFNGTGNNNTANGFKALYSNTTGQQNTATGFAALYSNNGDYNSAHGTAALNNNTNGSWNTANGAYAMYLNTTGSNNTATGEKALYKNKDGSDNTAIGTLALINNENGLFNTAVGGRALYWNTTGDANIAIGYQAGPNSADLNYTTALGLNATTSESNQVRIGSIGDQSDPVSIGGKVDWSTLSDARVKKNIKENVPGLIFINKLKPITYTVDNDAVNKIIQPPAIKDKNGNIIKRSDDVAAGKANTAIVYTGFAAQEVEKAARSLKYDFSGVDAAKNDKDLYGLRYGEFVVPLVKAVQELSKMNDAKDSLLAIQQKINADLQKQIDELKAIIVSSQSAVNGQPPNVLSSASLQQNIPNPFTNTTSIAYALPQSRNGGTAQIVITDKSGETLKAISISGNKGNVKVDASTLASGAYQYSLIIDGKLIATKQMILAK
ncbi:MAG TPA: tail fiber domain-containing protein [Parafilimonas sp.]|nr:tail fiber domain-containing protein [Parafilimonas sp.]